MPSDSEPRDPDTDAADAPPHDAVPAGPPGLFDAFPPDAGTAEEANALDALNRAASDVALRDDDEQHLERPEDREASPFRDDATTEQGRHSARDSAPASASANARESGRHAFETEALLEELTEPQREAAAHVDGPALVLAGPGSGKTRVITRRVAHLVAAGIPAWQILALTFTNKAAREMRERVDALLPPDLPGRRGLTVATFHSFCALLLRRYGDRIGLKDGFSIYDTADQRGAMKAALAEVGMDGSNWTPASVLGVVSDAKNKLLDPTGFAEAATDFRERMCAKAYAAYQRILERNDAVDFDDLLRRVADLLRAVPDVRAELQQRFRYVLIDEYQDTNHAQFVIADAIASAHGNLFVVGDPDQSIYGWRGADIRNILEFEEHYANVRTIRLGQNFRSTGHIVAAADALIRHNRRRRHKDLHTDLGEGIKLRVVRAIDEHQEAEFVAQRLREANEEDGVAWRDMAILYRINALSRVLEDALRAERIPYVIARGTAFYDRREVKDAVSYLRALANPADGVALRRIVNVPARAIGDTTMRRVEAHAQDRECTLLEALRDAASIEGVGARARKSIGVFVSMFDRWQEALANGHPGQLPNFVAQVLTDSGLEGMHASGDGEEAEERLANLGEVVNAAADFEPVALAGIEDAAADAPPDEPESLLEALRAFLESIALVSDQDMVDERDGAVTLMTLHAAKGLEFPFVAMVGMEEGLLPHQRAHEQGEAELEEERRLCFVGMTRAERRLFLTSAASRATRGMRMATMESSFLREIPAETFERQDLSDTAFEGVDDDDGFSVEYEADPWGEHSLASRFPPGTTVRHAQFGVGVVRGVESRGSVSAARVHFKSAGERTLILEYAKLERLG